MLLLQQRSTPLLEIFRLATPLYCRVGLLGPQEVGLGFATPRLAKEGTYIDKKCPFTGNVSIRGRIIK